MSAKSGTISPAQAPAGSVNIPGTQIQAGVTSGLNVGDLLELSVRANPAEGAGLIYLKGQLIQAQLPQNVVSGDLLLARVEKNGEQVLFKILEIIKPAAGQGSTQGYTQGGASANASLPLQGELSEAFESLIATLSASLPQEGQKIFLPKDLTPADGSPAKPPASALAQELAKALVDVAQLQDSNAVTLALQAVTNGSVSQSLRAIAESIRDSLATAAPLPTETDRVFETLRQVIVALLNKEPADPTVVARAIDRLGPSLQDELRPERKSLPGEAKDVLRKVQAELAAAKNTPADTQARSLQSALLQLDAKSLGTGQHKGAKAEKTNTELQVLATRLDALAATYDSMNQLNVVLHAFGEPAMILFPFLFAGMISHSELVVDPDASGRHSKKKKGDSDADGGEGEDSGDAADSTLFQRVHLTVPLPTLGLVGVEVAHRHSEVLTRISVETAEMASFFQERMDDLLQALKEANINLVDFATGIGVDESKLLERRIAGDTHASFIA